ncbi:peptide-methionine (S)-S-oxide reductase MsrA [Rhodoluna sp.]|jgi:peptide-methionine (S)-S-oxide reductase|uniref:peptide-methionine (S)-S-oxide reductase MsrA n=1 Tax=Rhodoluna sp. TaxID=1969481 RepID=UPI0025DF7FA9|nr:peptide-methionine (S)-S-oxide reductase MsrA [Rhodoluna sp.]
MMSFVLGGGCFWCLDSCYTQFKGVQDAVVGYMGGSIANPGYEAVCGGNTGHAEVVKVIFDESVIPADVILDLFFTMHDPTQLNRQGHDVGTQYRSVMFYADDSQKQMFEAAISRAAELWDGEIVTELSPATEFWVGEEYHQDFFDKNPNQGYCNAVVAPKMAKTRAVFTNFLK